MFKGVQKEIKKIQKWVASVADGANIEDFLNDAAETYMDTLEDPSVASINNGLWFEAEKFVETWRENYEQECAKKIDEYMSKTDALIVLKDGKWTIDTRGGDYSYESFSEMMEDIKINLEEMRKLGF